MLLLKILMRLTPGEAGRGRPPLTPSASPAGPAGGRSPVCSILKGTSGMRGSGVAPRAPGRGLGWLRGPVVVGGVRAPCGHAPWMWGASSPLSSSGKGWLPSASPPTQSPSLDSPFPVPLPLPGSDPRQLEVAAGLSTSSLSRLLSCLP